MRTELDISTLSKWIHYLTISFYVLLIGSLFLGSWFYGPASIASRLVLWLLLTSGLLLVTYGLFKKSRRSYQWLCFILLLYFIGIVQALFAGTPKLHEWLALVAIIGGFISSMLAARWH